MIDDTVLYLKSEVETFAVVFEKFDYPKALFVVRKAAFDKFIQHAFSRVSERGVSQVVSERYRLDKVFVEVKCARYRPAYLRYFESVREAGAVMVAFRGYEYLSLVFEPSERLAVHYAVAVAHKVRT